MDDDDRVLSEEQARQLWQRAAELQAEAARQLEARSRALVRPGDVVEGGFRLEHVREAASEAGISEEFVELALAEQAEVGPARGVDRWADRFLGPGARAAVASRTFDRPAADIYASLQRVLPRYQLSLVDSRGGDPLDGGVLVFDLPALSGLETTDPVLRDMRLWADLRELHVRVRALDAERTEVTVHAPTTQARRLNLFVSGGVVAVGGLVGATAGAAIGVLAAEALAFGVPGAVLLVALATVLGFALATAALTPPMRWLYRWGQSRGEAAMQRLLQAVGVDLRTGGAFQPPTAAPPPLPPGQPSSPT